MLARNPIPTPALPLKGALGQRLCRCKGSEYISRNLAVRDSRRGRTFADPRRGLLTPIGKAWTHRMYGRQMLPAHGPQRDAACASATKARMSISACFSLKKARL
jgi:hypothetical protein